MPVPTVESPPRARLTPPDLHDETRYRRIPRVPWIDSHVRRVRRDGRLVEERVGPEQLGRIARNSQRRSGCGNYGLLTPGHLRTERRFPEVKQPPASRVDLLGEGLGAGV